MPAGHDRGTTVETRTGIHDVERERVAVRPMVEDKLVRLRMGGFIQAVGTRFQNQDLESGITRRQATRDDTRCGPACAQNSSSEGRGWPLQGINAHLQQE